MYLYFKTMHTHTHTHTQTHTHTHPYPLGSVSLENLNKTPFSAQLLCMSLQFLFHMLTLFPDTSTSAFGEPALDFPSNICSPSSYIAEPGSSLLRQCAWPLVMNYVDLSQQYLP